MLDHNQRVQISLVGAGPGDPELLTVKAVRRIQEADVILYDALIGEAWVVYCSASVEKIPVGKRKGKACTQERIHEILLEYAQKNLKIVRLKGGDSLVFGRGGEEIRFLAEHGYVCEVIPGISSSIAVPASAGVAVTDRDFSHSFGVVSAHRKDDGGLNDLAVRKALRGVDTLVVLMVKSRLQEICRLAQAELWDLSTPCALIVDGTTDHQQAWQGILGDFKDAEVQGVPEGPGLFVLGYTSAESNRLPTLSHDQTQWHTHLAPKRVNIAKSNRAKALMIQGTSSNAGKSVLTAAFCRILLQEGYKVAPFKAQNMSNNAAVTPCGGEIGRAQAYQATACGLEADVRMNPLLLKPQSSMGSQVILKGQAVGQMPATEYMQFRPQAQAVIHECYDSLAAEYDVIVLEGAGSPAEVNLRPYDLVNMHMAHYSDASVLLVGDIDRGGIFASFIGTYHCLSKEDQSLIHGYLVNRFRGDESLLTAAYDFMQAQTGIPVLGTVPFIADLAIPDEDAVTLRQRRSGLSQARPDQIDVVLLDIPMISNQSDFDVLEQEVDVHLRIVRHPSELVNPDVVIFPGSKSVLADYGSLRDRGLLELIKSLQDVEIVGICGGLQMIGKSIKDSGFESEGQLEALGLLDIQTVFHESKIVKRNEGLHKVSRTQVVGYEIHHGRTEGSAEVAFLSLSGSPLGYSSPDGRVWGTYLHGVFDSPEFRHEWIQKIRDRKGLGKRSPSQILSLDQAMDALAAAVRPHINLSQILQKMGLN